MFRHFIDGNASVSLEMGSCEGLVPTEEEHRDREPDRYPSRDCHLPDMSGRWSRDLVLPVQNRGDAFKISVHAVLLC